MRIRDWTLVLVLALAAIVVSLTCYAQTPLEKPPSAPQDAFLAGWAR